MDYGAKQTNTVIVGFFVCRVTPLNNEPVQVVLLFHVIDEATSLAGHSER